MLFSWRGLKDEKSRLPAIALNARVRGLKGHGFQPCREEFVFDFTVRLEAAPFQQGAFPGFEQTSKAKSFIRALVAALVLLSSANRAFAQAAQPSTADSTPSTYTIAGTIVSKTDGRPLARARVSIANVKDLQHSLLLITGDDGVFSFTNLPAGKYDLEGAKRGFINGGYEQHEMFSTAIVTGAGIDTEHLRLRLTPEAYIVGKVLDENGEPVRRANVALYMVNHYEGFNRISQAGWGQTDDLGSYEIGPRIPGTYFVSVNAQPWYAIHPPKIGNTKGQNAPQVDSSLDVAYPITYYGDTTDPDAATPIQLRGGNRFQADIHVGPVPALHLLMHVPQMPNGGYNLPQLQQTGLGENIPVPANPRQISQGVWEITGVPAGNYSAQMFGGPNGQAMRTTEVSLTNDGQEIDTSSAEASSTVKLVVQVAAEKAIPSQLNAGLRSVHNRMYYATLDSKGEGQLQQVVPGRYEVIGWNMGKPYAISHVSAEGAQMSGRTLIVDPGSNITLSVTFVAGTQTVEGVVKHDGRPIAGAMVVLVPKDPDNHRDMFRRDQSDLDGTFSMGGVVPGKYTVLAIEDGWDLDWSRPEVIAPYAKRGQIIEVTAQHGGTLKLTEPVEAQSK